MPMNISNAPHLTDKRIQRVYIKGGRRRIMTDNGMMTMPASLSRMMFGKLRGGKYSEKQ